MPSGLNLYLRFLFGPDAGILIPITVCLSKELRVIPI